MVTVEDILRESEMQVDVFGVRPAVQPADPEKPEGIMTGHYSKYSFETAPDAPEAMKRQQFATWDVAPRSCGPAFDQAATEKYLLLPTNADTAGWSD